MWFMARLQHGRPSRNRLLAFGQPAQTASLALQLALQPSVALFIDAGVAAHARRFRSIRVLAAASLAGFTAWRFVAAFLVAASQRT
jgi:hypothetical protein